MIETISGTLVWLVCNMYEAGERNSGKTGVVISAQSKRNFSLVC